MTHILKSPHELKQKTTKNVCKTAVGLLPTKLETLCKLFSNIKLVPKLKRLYDSDHHYYINSIETRTKLQATHKM